MPEKESKPENSSSPAPAATPTATNQPASPKSSNNKLIIIIVVIVVVLAILGGLGFVASRFLVEKTAEKAIEQATGAKVDVQNDGKKVTVETDKGKLTVGEDEVPKSFPSDITVYPGAKVVGTAETSTDVSLQLKTGDSVSKAYDFYKDDLAKNGWAISSSATYSGSALVTAQKGSKSVTLTVAPDESDNKTTISMMVTLASN